MVVVVSSGFCYDIHVAGPVGVDCLGSFVSLLEVSCGRTVSLLLLYTHILALYYIILYYVFHLFCSVVGFCLLLFLFLCIIQNG